MSRFDHSRSRPATTALLDLAESGEISWEQIARDALAWLSEQEVQDFAEAYDYFPETEDEE